MIDRNDILRMASEADDYANSQWRVTVHPEHWRVYRDEHFAKLVAEAERQACIDLCKDAADRYYPNFAEASGACTHVLSVIQSRGEE